MKEKKGLAVVALLMLLIAMATICIFKNNDDMPETQLSSDHPLLAKRIFMENPSETIINFSALRTSLNTYFRENNLEGSLYFEYLPTGTSIRINGNDEFRAASLMKLPVAMEVYKAQERGLLQLDTKVSLKKEWLNDGYGDLYKKGAGYEISISELTKLLLIDSDNTALRALIEATSELKIEDRALGALDVELTQGSKGEIDIGTRSYSSFLKCLYFACYNNIEQSEQILGYLTESNFNQKIVAGIARNVKVAHKIGVFNDQVQGDCGIVYLESKNYILCIMLKEDDSQNTDKYFKELSNQAYNFLNSK